MSESYVIVCLGYGKQCYFYGQYLEWFDPNIPDPTKTMATFTHNLSKAKRFATAADAFSEWKRVREVDPVRPDGKPNRPLTAFNIEVRKMERNDNETKGMDGTHSP